MQADPLGSKQTVVKRGENLGKLKKNNVMFISKRGPFEHQIQMQENLPNKIAVASSEKVRMLKMRSTRINPQNYSLPLVYSDRIFL